MITFKQFIAEVGDKKVDFKVVAATPMMYQAEAKINDRKVTFSGREEDDKQWWVVFASAGDGGLPLQGTTGQGGEFEVSGFVISALRDLIERYDPEVITFSADKDDDSEGTARANVYEKLAARKFPAFDVKRKNIRDGTAYFVMTKKS